MRLPQRCVGSDSNVILVAEVDELSIGKVRLHFYLVHGRFDSSVREYVLKLQFNNIERYWITGDIAHQTIEPCHV